MTGKEEQAARVRKAGRLAAVYMASVLKLDPKLSKRDIANAAKNLPQAAWEELAQQNGIRPPSVLTVVLAQANLEQAAYNEEIAGQPANPFDGFQC